MKLAYIGEDNEISRQVFEKVARQGTQVDFKPRGSPEGMRVSNLRFAYTWMLLKGRIIESILQAQKEGYDAAIIQCFEDPGLHEAREVARIPVIGLSEASMFLACMLGSRFAILIPDEVGIKIAVLENIRKYGLESRVIENPVRAISLPLEESLPNRVVSGPDAVKKRSTPDPRVVASVVEDARACVKDGAEVVVLGCCGVGPYLTAAGVTKVTVDGRDAPVLDCVSVGIKTAEFMVDVRDNMGIPVPSRTGMYRPPGESTLNAIRRSFGFTA